MGCKLIRTCEENIENRLNFVKPTSVFCADITCQMASEQFLLIVLGKTDAHIVGFIGQYFVYIF
jgi:hypothetical protein